MKNLRTIGFALVLTAFGLALLPACAELMGGATGEVMDKDEAMGKSGAMMEKEKAMMETKGAMMEKGNPGKMRTARLGGSDGHDAVGTVVITTDQNGVAILRLKDITVDKVPDGRVYLARNGDYRNGVELGKLTKFSGTVTLPIPAGIRGEDYDSVVIWCKKFNVEIGRAFFDKTMEAGGSMMEKEKKMMGADAMRK